MPSTYSPNLRVELIANGEQSGTWGNTTNVNLGTILDSAVAGYTDVTVGNVTDLALTANNGASDQSRNMIVQLNSATGDDFNLFIPPASKFYVIRNATTKTATVGNSTALNGIIASGGTIVTIKAGVTSLIFSDGTNVREALTGFAGNLIVEGDLTVNGDTTLGNARVSGTYTYVSASVIQVNTGTPHGYTAGQSVGLIVTSVTDGNAKSGYYAIAGTPTATQFNLTYTPANLTSLSAGSCLVTNDTITINGIVFPGVVIDGSSTLPALRITQTGGGAALLIDDAANPDSTPFLVDTSGNVVVGNTAALTTFNNATTTPRIQEIGIIANDAAMGVALFNATPATSGVLDFAKSAAAAVGTYTAVASGEALGLIRFSGADGTNLQPAATIGGFADALFTGTLAPGRLVFSTAPSVTNNTLVERMRINSAGNVIIGSGEGTTSATGGILRAPDETGGSNLTGGTLTIAAGNGTGTSGGSGYIRFQTAPANTTGAATDATTLATVMSIAKTGNVGIGSESLTSISFRISKNIANPAGGTAYGIYQDGTIPSATPLITQVIYNNTLANTEAASFNVDSILHYRASQSTFTGGSSVDDQYGYVADSTLVGATDNYGFYAEDTAAVVATKTAYGFYSGVNTATGGGTAYGFYAAGTATNYFASNLLLGGATPATLVNGQVTATNRLAAVADDNEVSVVIRGSSTTNTTGYPVLALQKTLAATAATLTTTTSGSNLGVITFDGVNLNGTPAIAQGAAIATFQDATATTSFVPAGLRFYTTNTANGIGERMRINSTGTISIGATAQNGAALTTTAPAKLYVSTGTYTDSVTAAGNTVTHGTVVSINNPQITASNATSIAKVTYTTASTVYIDGAPSTVDANTVITNPYALYIAGGNTYFGGDITSGSTLTISFDSTTVANAITPLEIKATSTGTPSAGIATGISFSTETTVGGNVETGAAIRSIATDIGVGTEDFDLSFLTMANGSDILATTTGNTSERMRVKSTGELQFDSGYGSVATAYGCRAWAQYSGNPTDLTTYSGLAFSRAGTVVTITQPSHGFVAGQALHLTFSTAVTTGYYVIDSVPTTSTFRVISTASGTAAGTVSYNKLLVKDSGNIAFISGRPDYPTSNVINFSTPMPDANFAWSGSASGLHVDALLYVAGKYGAEWPNTNSLPQTTRYVALTVAYAYQAYPNPLWNINNISFSAFR